MAPASSSSSTTEKRRNLEMRVVENAKRRRVTFAKRRQGLFSKAEELGAACSVDVAVVAFTSCGKAFSFGDDAIRRYLLLTGEHDGNQDGREEGSSEMEDPVRRLRFLEELRRKAIARAEDLAQARAQAAAASRSSGGTEAGEPFLVGATTCWGPSPLAETPVADCSHRNSEEDSPEGCGKVEEPFVVDATVSWPSSRHSSMSRDAAAAD
ncbi:hypothetical protein MUK42_08523 [Musa troglodytarum]|uniref:MADS-box domain-containing protein n=1 Tax=Musa troglodytarum TaxID=320322 RepID=A0A9E7JAF7_9LILI|nr:hypothetical protein MUK42_08523 [Musa troglodytarum]